MFQTILTGGASGGAAVAIAAANAIKAFGAIVQLEPRDFEALLKKAESPLLVCSEGGMFSTKYQYLMGYRGLVFYTKSQTPLSLSAEVETVQAKNISIPW